MILFETKYNKVFNLTINYLLKKEKTKDIGDIIETIAPKHLRREQFTKCVNTFSKFIEWTEDKYYHHLDNLSKVLLYKYLTKEGIQETLNNLKKNKNYQLKLKTVIEEYIIDKEVISKNMYNINWYINNLFIDKHIITISNYKTQEELKKYIKKFPDISINYWDILPLKIQKNLNCDINLYQSINILLDFIQENINYGSLTNLFWNNENSKNEKEIQEVLICLFNAYFYNNDIDINRETIIGSGKIDFKFYKYQDEKIIFEIKKANNQNLKFGYEKQLIDYMDSCNCHHAYYIILCFDDKDIKKVENFHEKLNKYYHYNIEIIIFDLRKKDIKINDYNESIFNKDIPNEVDKYFEYILKVLTLNNSYEFIKYLEKLQLNYKKINSNDIKQDYLLKIHEVSTFYKKEDNLLINPFSEEFYIIYEKDVLRKLVLNLLHDITNESSFFSKTNEIITLLKTYSYNEYNERISKKDILEIFNYLKEEHPMFYNIIKKENLRIYLLNETSNEYNSTIIPTMNMKSYLILCSNMMKKEKEGFSKYVFFYLLGYMFNLIILKTKGEVREDFLISMLPYTEGLKKDDNDACILFADSMAMYLMHNSKYDKYNPFIKVNEDVYNKLQNYFDKLLKEVMEDDSVSI